MTGVESSMIDLLNGTGKKGSERTFIYTCTGGFESFDHACFMCCIHTVILLPVHILHLLRIILSLGCKVFISANPRLQKCCRLVIKIVFWTQKFAVGLIDMGKSESLAGPISPKL